MMWWLTMAACTGTAPPSVDSDLPVDTDVPTVCGPPEVALVHGDGTPFDFGDVVELQLGPQGGFHYELYAVVVGVNADVRLLPMVTVDGTDFVVAGDQFPQNLSLNPYDPDECAGETGVFRAFLRERDFGFVCALQDRIMNLRVEVEDLITGAETVTERRFVTQVPAEVLATCE